MIFITINFIFLLLTICSVSDGFPDPRTSLLNQKLQMLNVCMDRRRIREGNLPFSVSNANKPLIGEHHSESEDEFFDCPSNADDDKSKHHYEPWNKPEGRLSKLNDMKLIEGDEFLYIPITQEPVPKTEDQLEDDAEVMLRLGPESGKLCNCPFNKFKSKCIILHKLL